MKKLLVLLIVAALAAPAFAQNLVRGNLVTVWGFGPSLSPANVAANTTAEQSFTVTGLKTGDIVLGNKPTAQAGLGVVGMRVSATDTLAITFVNATASGITPTASQTWTFAILRPENQPLPTIVSP